MNRIEPPAPEMVRKVVIASVVGNAFEWFDFAIYGLFAGTISELYFPSGNAWASLMLALVTFGVGFAVRPIGGVLIGIYGDRVGRKKALSLTIALMALGTGMMGLLPTYASIGLAAPLLLVLARLLQGVSAGGEFGGATTMLVEFAPANRRGLFASFQMCSQALAFAIGAAVAYLMVRYLDPFELRAWGWRLPFLFGILVGPVGWWLRSRVDESPVFADYLRNTYRSDHQPAVKPIRTLLTLHTRQLVASTFVCIVGTVSAYIFVFFVPILAKQRLGLDSADVNLCTFLSTVVILLVCPFAGFLSDRYGRKKVLIPAILFYALTVSFLFPRFVAAPSLSSLLTLQLGASLSMSFIWGPVPIALTEGFPVAVRSTGAALAYNIAVLLFGGLAPAINTWLVKITGSNLAPLYYVLFSASVGLVGAILLPRQRMSSYPASVQPRST